jgi:molybdate transport system ATP-binding protein
MIYLDFTYQNPSLSMQIKVKTKSQIVFLYGHSGVGKTTILKMIAGLKQPQYGLIDIAGRRFFDASKNINIAPQSKKCRLCISRSKIIFPFECQRQYYFWGLKTKQLQQDH